MVKPIVKIPPSEFVQRVFRLNNEPFSIKEFPYLYDIYDSDAREIGLFTARQISKSTSIASMLVANSITKPNSSQVLVSPLQEQAVVFSTTRLKDFIMDSPIVRDGFFTGAGVIDQVLRKQFNNGAVITLGYAARTADRLRGRSIVGDNSLLAFDELADIFPDVIPVIKEMAFRAKRPRFMYCGTPKSMNNHMEAMRQRSTGSEWAVKCPAIACKKWNLTWSDKNIGDRGVICEFCGSALDTNTGQWVARRHLDIEKGKDASVTMASYRIPQLIVKPIMDDPHKWVELLSKLRTYPTDKFKNEVLGLPHDSGSQPVTYDQLAACCNEERANVPPAIGTGNFPPLVMGVDWAFMGENSYTFVTIGAWSPFPSKFELFYWKIYKGSESDSHFQIQDILKLYHLCGCRLITADWGAGHVQNLSLIEAVGENHVAQVWHTGMRGKAGGRQRAKWEPKTRKWHLARTAVLTDTFETVKRQQIVFPRVSACDILFKHILAESLEFNELTNSPQYSNADPDDGLHSLTYCMLGGELLIAGDFRGHAGSVPIQGIGTSRPDQGPDSLDGQFDIGAEYYQ